MVVAIPVLVVGIGMIAYAYMTPPTNPYYNENDIYYYLGGLFVLMVILLGPFVLFKERDNARKKYLMENGLQGPAEILNRKKNRIIYQSSTSNQIPARNNIPRWRNISNGT